MKREFVFELKQKFPWIMITIGLIIIPVAMFALEPTSNGAIIFVINLISLSYYYTCIVQSIFKCQSLVENINPMKWIFYGFKVQIPKKEYTDIYEAEDWLKATAKRSVLVRSVNNENVFIFQDEQDLMKFIMVWGDKI